LHRHRRVLELTSSRDIQVLKTYGAASYGAAIKKLEQQIKEKQQSVDEKIGVKVHSMKTIPDMAYADCLCRNQIPAWRHLTFGMSPLIANGCRKSSRFR
jgi:hypothetical protein